MEPHEGQWIDDETPPEAVERYLVNLTRVDGDKLPDIHFAEQHGLDPRTLRRWKKDERFRKLWARMADESVLGPDTLSPIYEAAVKIASDPDHPQWSQASKMILSLAEKIRPPKIEISVSPEQRFQSMSDEQLAAYLNGAPTPIETTAHELEPPALDDEVFADPFVANVLKS